MALVVLSYPAIKMSQLFKCDRSQQPPPFSEVRPFVGPEPVGLVLGEFIFSTEAGRKYSACRERRAGAPLKFDAGFSGPHDTMEPALPGDRCFLDATWYEKGVFAKDGVMDLNSAR